MSMIKISSRIKDYTLHFVETSDFIKDLHDQYPTACYVIDENVWRLYGDSALAPVSRGEVIIQPVNEDRKNLDSVQELYERLTKRSAKRNMTMISIGGGIVQDITGFVASTMYRGINWNFIPTTLLAQADSCIGGKTSLNFKGFKNLIGTFYPPSQIYIYADFVKTLGETDFFSGLGEVVKLHLLGGENMVREGFALQGPMSRRDPVALHQGVKNALTIKHGYIAEDEFDLGRRNMLNFGHCFGHALEAVSNFEIPHGQGVVVGMVLANRVAQQRGILADSLERTILEQLLLPSLRVCLHREYFQTEAVIEAMKKDKKRTGDGLALIMLKDGYEFDSVKNLTETEASQALGETIAILSAHGFFNG